jgi:ABC-type glucose/galactose transport system permease subunit
MTFLQNTNILVPMVVATIYGAVKVSHTNFYPGIDALLNQNTLYGIMIMMHAMFGISPVSELPERTKALTSSVWFKLLSLLIISFSATRDFEDAVLVLITFLGIIQLLRTKEERKKYPYIIV